MLGLLVSWDAAGISATGWRVDAAAGDPLREGEQKQRHFLLLSPDPLRSIESSQTYQCPGCNLLGTDLSGADLRRANLEGRSPVA
ncbi:MAG: pentapeptide repeat-containing protein [Coleofasciculaceae cyanobacterium SM2_3_26]|nr:pentapeptide repeat-containing protein [Coleofasciculaceae cyanobacterium SM2_3_26]